MYPQFKLNEFLLNFVRNGTSILKSSVIKQNSSSCGKILLRPFPSVGHGGWSLDLSVLINHKKTTKKKFSISDDFQSVNGRKTVGNAPDYSISSRPTRLGLDGKQGLVPGLVPGIQEWENPGSLGQPWDQDKSFTFILIDSIFLLSPCPEYPDTQGVSPSFSQDFLRR